MPKFTDAFFKIPVKVFRDETENFDESTDSATAWARIPFDDLYLCDWYEGYSIGTLGVQADSAGFDVTVIRTPAHKYLCVWTMKEFEQELNKFMAKVDENADRNRENDLTI